MDERARTSAAAFPMRLALLLTLLAAALLPRPAAGRVVAVGGRGQPTLAEAIAAVPELRRGLPAGEPLELRLPPGIVRVTAPIRIDADHGGTQGSPLVIRGAPGGATRIVGAVPLRSRPAPPGAVPGRVLPRGTMVVDLVAAGAPASLDRRGAYIATPTTSLALFAGDHWLTPARWPRTGFLPAATVPRPDGSLDVRPAPGAVPPGHVDAATWAAGYWSAAWAYERLPIHHNASGVLRTARLETKLPPVANARIRLENVAAALREPGTFVVQPDRGRALVVPPARGAGIEVAIAPHLLVIDKATDVRLHDLAFSRSAGDAIRVVGARRIVFVDCSVRQAAGNGITVNGGTDVILENVHVAQTGERGVSLGGGDRGQLIRSNHRFLGGSVTDFGLLSPSYRPGIWLWGVGAEVRGARIARGDHAAIILDGNEHRIEDNEIRAVLRDTGDAGAIYMGADWTARGNVIAGNHIHDLGNAGHEGPLVGIYLDDQASGTTVRGNVVAGGDFGVLIGGGRDNLLEENVFAGARRGAVWIDARGIESQRARLAEFQQRAAAVPTRSAAWAKAYPLLAALPVAQHGVPDGNSLSRNVAFGAVPMLVGPKNARDLVDETASRVRPLADFAAFARGEPGVTRVLRPRAQP